MNSGLKKVHVNSLVAAKASDATQSAVLGPPDIWIVDDQLRFGMKMYKNKKKCVIPASSHYMDTAFKAW